jgi:hypothetical protein
MVLINAVGTRSQGDITNGGSAEYTPFARNLTHTWIWYERRCSIRKQLIHSSLLSISEDLHSRTVNTGAKAQLEMIQIVLIDVIITDKAEWTRVS